MSFKEKGSKKLSWKKAALFLKDGMVGVIPTDTIYGICASALDKKAVEKVYKLRKRNPKKPMIVLISSFDDLRRLSVRLDSRQKVFLKKSWPGKVSVVLKCRDKNKKLAYLHRGTKTLAFRLPKKRELLKILKISGPLIAPSANLEGQEPAKNINQAKKYFGGNIFYFGGKTLSGKSSTLVDLTDGIKILRK